MILSVEVRHADNPEGDYWFLNTAEDVAEEFDLPMVTQPGFHNVTFIIDLTKVEIGVHLEGEPEMNDGPDCPYCGQAMGAIHRTLGDSLSGPLPYCLHQEQQDLYADFSPEGENADEYEPTLEDYIDSYEPPF